VQKKSFFTPVFFICSKKQFSGARNIFGQIEAHPLVLSKIQGFFWEKPLKRIQIIPIP
jgi:hypothetical protein